MKLKIVIFAVLCACALVIVPNSMAAVYHFSPGNEDIFDLDHYKYYTWGINWTPQPNEVIVGARLRINNINNWTEEDTDKLYIHLLGNAPLGLRTYTDNQGGGDNFEDWSGKHILLDVYSDADDYPGPAEDYIYHLSNFELKKLNKYTDDGRFGLGFDPDCHFWNDGVKFVFRTEIIPEPASILLLTSGLLGGFVSRRKRIL